MSEIEDNQKDGGIRHREDISMMDALIRCATAWMFIVVMVIGLPLGTVTFPFIKVKDDKEERGWVASLWHMFRCGLITLVLVAGCLVAYWLYQQGSEVNFAQ